jgi:hypothetical protein
MPFSGVSRGIDPPYMTYGMTSTDTLEGLSRVW